MLTSDAAKIGDKPVTVLAYLGLGSNLGDRAANLQAALNALNRLKTCEVQEVSTFHETAPAFLEEQPDFLNACAGLNTTLGPIALLRELQKIEADLGRVRSVVNGPRTIDLDILFYGDQILEGEELSVPHPGAHERLFVLGPLAEIAGGFVHPVLKLPVSVLLQNISHE